MRKPSLLILALCKEKEREIVWRAARQVHLVLFPLAAESNLRTVFFGFRREEIFSSQNALSEKWTA